MVKIDKSLILDTENSDLSWGSFSPGQPWNLDFKECELFEENAKLIRSQAAIEAEKLLERKTFFPISRVFQAVSRIGSAVFVWWIFDKRKGREKSYNSISKKLRKQFVHLGSTYIKLGQIISSGDGLFPTELVAEFKLLRDQVDAENFSEIKKVIEHSRSGLSIR